MIVLAGWRQRFGDYELARLLISI